MAVGYEAAFQSMEGISPGDVAGTQRISKKANGPILKDWWKRIFNERIPLSEMIALLFPLNLQSQHLDCTRSQVHFKYMTVSHLFLARPYLMEGLTSISFCLANLCELVG